LSEREENEMILLLGEEYRRHSEKPAMPERKTVLHEIFILYSCFTVIVLLNNLNYTFGDNK